ELPRPSSRGTPEVVRMKRHELPDAHGRPARDPLHAVGESIVSSPPGATRPWSADGGTHTRIDRASAFRRAPWLRARRSLLQSSVSVAAGLMLPRSTRIAQLVKQL